MNQRVGAEAINPEGVGGQGRILCVVMSIFMECEELPLKGMIAQCMGNHEGKEHRERRREIALGKGIEVL